MRIYVRTAIICPPPIPEHPVLLTFKGQIGTGLEPALHEKALQRFPPKAPKFSKPDPQPNFTIAKKANTVKWNISNYLHKHANITHMANQTSRNGMFIHVVVYPERVISEKCSVAVKTSRNMDLRGTETLAQ